MKFLLIESFKIDEIVSIMTKKQAKNIISIEVNRKNNINSMIIVDLITDMDSKTFITKTKFFIEQSQNK